MDLQTLTHVFTLGKTSISVKDELIIKQRKKTILLFIYMSLTPGDCSRERLASLFWPESTRASSLTCLRRCLFDLNKCGLASFIEADRNTVSVKLDNVWIDAVQFQDHLERCHAHGHPISAVCQHCIPELSQAIELYKGDFLRDMTIPDSVEFDNWHQLHGQELGTLHRMALERYGIYLASEGDFSRATSMVQKLINLDPLREWSRQLMMLIYAQMDNTQAAIEHYETYKVLLDEELAISPGDTIRNLYYTLVQRGDFGDFIDYKERVLLPGSIQLSSKHEIENSILDTAVIHDRSLSAIADNLDNGFFIGREIELAQVIEQLQQTDCQLLTILGLGGVGKKRLAVEVARQLQHDFDDGVYFANLRHTENTLPLRHQIASTLGFSFYSGSNQEEQLINYLQEKSILLILCGFESYIDDVAWLNKLLNVARQVKLLVTSRVRLNLPQERMLFLEGLKNDPDNQHPGRSLFVKVARTNNINIDFRPEDRIYIDEIIELVDGVPLALYLAASWTSLMSCRDIADAIKDDMSFLNETHQTNSEYHHSLHDIFDQTWRLLTNAEQEQFAALSMFEDTFLLDSAKTIAKTSISEIGSLVSKSLVTRVEDRRFRVHALLRQFAQEKLREHTDIHVVVQDRFMHYYADFAEALGNDLTGPRVGIAITQLRAEILNILLAWEFSLQCQRYDLLYKLLSCIHHYYRLYDLNDVGDSVLQRAISQISTDLVADENQYQTNLFLAKAYIYQSWFRMNLGDRHGANEVVEKAYKLALNLQVKDVIATALTQKGYLALFSRDLDHAYELIEESLRICRTRQDFEGLGKAANTLSIILRRQNRVKEAKAYARMSLEQYQRLQDPLLQSYAFNTLGLIALQEGHYEEARQLFHRSQTLKQEIMPDSRWMEACSMMNLGLVAKHQNDLNTSREYLHQSVHLFRDIGHPDMFIHATEELGDVLIEVGYLNQAGQFLSEGLHKAWDIDNDEIALRIMAKIAKLMCHQKEFEKAHELVDSILRHPSCTDEIGKLALEAIQD